MTQRMSASHQKAVGSRQRGPITCVLIVEDYEPMRRYLRSSVQQRPELRIVAEVTDGIDAIHKAGELQPHLVLMDIGLPTLNGIEATRRIQKVSPQSKILFVTANSSSEVAEEALRCGGIGYVLKSSGQRDLLSAIDAVLRGELFFKVAPTELTNKAADQGGEP